MRIKFNMRVVPVDRLIGVQADENERVIHLMVQALMQVGLPACPNDYDLTVGSRRLRQTDLVGNIPKTEGYLRLALRDKQREAEAKATKAQLEQIRRAEAGREGVLQKLVESDEEYEHAMIVWLEATGRWSVRTTDDEE
jgi:hypothetical protein